MPPAGPTPQGALDPAVLDRLAGLPLVARTVVEGYRAGHHRSPYRGSSAEFAQHREYVAGDEIRRIDWKIFARQDRLVVKEFAEETNLDCHILVDASRSMDYASLRWSKFAYARWCAAALAHLVLTSRDSAGLVLFNSAERGKVAPANGAAQLLAITSALQQAQPQGETALGAVLRWLGTRLRRRGIVVVLSDFFDDPRAIADGLRLLVHAGHEPILLEVLDPQELEFDFSGYLRLADLEGATRLKLDPKAVRAAYLEELAAHRAELGRQARALALDYVQLSSASSLEVVLSSYLARRAARSRGGRA
jgi:uncharacterized protein (DUF58 family)